MKRAIAAALAAALPLAVAAALTAPPAGAAGTFQGSLTVSSIGAQSDPSDPVVVTADGAVAQQCAPNSGCAWLPYVTSVAATARCSPAVTASTWVGDAYDHLAGQQPQRFTASWREWPSSAAGARKACLYVRTSAGDTLLAESPFTVPRPIVLPPGSGVPRAPIPRSVGLRRHFAYRLSLTAIPRGVDRTRYSLVARAAAKRWGLRFAGFTTRPARSGDGIDTVGFSPSVPSYALGVTSIRTVRYYRRTGGRPRLVRQRVVERDTRLAAGAPWHAGPGDPPADRVDLQTVVIHELGHYAGNRHVRNCTNSPMWVALRPGEWWHSRTDWFQFGCGRDTAQARAAHARAATAGALPRRLLVERTYRDVVLD
jgi:hypothetical protein